MGQTVVYGCHQQINIGADTDVQIKVSDFWFTAFSKELENFLPFRGDFYQRSIKRRSRPVRL